MTGRAISHYEVLEKLGEGGMGVVYKARDTRLDRFVALKVLPAEKIASQDRKLRFVQEAKAASALNNPHIITIYDIDQADGQDFIAMEFVRGKALDELIPRKGLRLNDALKIAIQIADALTAAHAAGIVHRDLKPANVMVGDNGQAKVLDFGLAKLSEQSGTTEFDRTKTNVDRPKTEEGLIVGTISYMSPEQAEGKRVDARSDIFSFGALLYEMLTGRRAFEGDSKMSTLAAILNREPAPVEQVPREVVRIVQRCLRKEVDRRAQSMADLKLALEEVKEESESGKLAGSPAVERGRGRRTIGAALSIALIALAGSAFWILRSDRTPQAALQAVPLTSYPGEESYPSFSPDGNQVAFSWNGEKQDNYDIYVKLIGSGRPLRLTTDPSTDSMPAWSPDGRSIAFVRPLRDGKTKVLLIPALGGPEREIAEFTEFQTQSLHPSLAWSPDGRWITVSPRESAVKSRVILLVSAETGEKRQLTFPSAGAAGDNYGVFSPDGRGIAFVREISPAASDVYALSLAGDFTVKEEPRRLTFDNRRISGIAWTADGRDIVFSSTRGGGLSLWRIALTGQREPRRLPVGENGRFPAVSGLGSRLVYSQANTNTNIWRVNISENSGRAGPFISSTRAEMNAQFSPDGKRIAFSSSRSGNLNVWVCDADGSNAVQLVSMGESSSPRWSPDSQRIAFDSNVEGHYQIYTVNAHGGTPRRMTMSPASDVRPSWSHDGKWIYFGSNRSGDNWQIWKIPANGGEAAPVTTKGGFHPVESDDGKTVFYAMNTTTSPLWQVPVDGGEPTLILDAVYNWNFAVTAGGIYFNTSAELRHYDFATGKSEPIRSIEKPVSIGMSVSPNNQWLLYSQIDQSGSDLMLVENFR